MAGKRKRRPVSRKKNPYTSAERFNLADSLKDVFLYHKSLFIILGIVIIVLVSAFAALRYVAETYTVTNIYVNGNTHYTNEEIIDMVLTDKLSNNSLYLSLKYRDKSIENVPFVEKMDVDIVSPDTIRINVYEKAVAGYIAYLGRYMYFDRDGIIVESSKEPSDDVPEVLGLDFNYVIIYEKLPVENEHVFAEILDITKLLDKYNLDANKIYFDKDYNVYLYFDDVEVSLGTEDYIDEKIIQLQYILPSLENKKGVLEMKDFDEDTQNITFEEKNH
jgi:cell division protein FtsQ